MTIDPLYLVHTNGEMNAMFLWDYGSIVGSPIPGRFLMRIASHRVSELLKERGIVKIEDAR